MQERADQTAFFIPLSVVAYSWKFCKPSNFPLASILLFALAVLGAASAQPVYNPSSAGAVLVNGGYSSFKAITGTFQVPDISGERDFGVTILVGFDGFSKEPQSQCIATFQAGVTISIRDDNSTRYEAWYNWFPGQTGFFDDIRFGPGDEIIVRLHVFNETSGLATINNLNTQESSYADVGAPISLCLHTAEWIVSTPYTFDFDDESALLAYFDQITFTDTNTTSNFGYDWQTAAEATIFSIQQDGKNLTFVSVERSSVSVKREY